MSTEGLAALKIDRTRQRSARRNTRWLTLVVLGIVAVIAVPIAIKTFAPVEVSVAPVVKAGIGASKSGASELNATGYVVADRQSVLASKVTGRLIKLLVVESQKVKKGDIVAEIHHEELDALIAQTRAEVESAAQEVKRLQESVGQAEAELAAAKAPLLTIDAQITELNIKLAEAQRKLERDKKLATSDAMPMSTAEDREFEVKAATAEIATAKERWKESEKRIAVVNAQIGMAKASVESAKARERAENARLQVLLKQREDYFVLAPFDGVITEKAAEVGEIVAPISVGGMMARGSVATLADWSSLQAEVDVSEAYIGRVKAGARAAINVDAFPDKTFPGKVLRILPRANRSKATVQVRVEFLERDDNVLPEMGVRVRFIPDDAPAGAESGEVKEKLLIPTAALQGAPGQNFVWIAADGVASKRAVTAGGVSGDHVEIKSGVKPGEKVITRGAENLREDGQKIKIAE